MNNVLIVFVVSITTHLAAFIYTASILSIPWLNSRRIQPFNHSIKKLFRELPIILINMCLITSLFCGAVYCLRNFIITNSCPCWIFFIQIVIIAITDDFYFYWFHRALHKSKFLYKHIHIIHHRASAPLPIEMYYVHPLEMLLGSFGIFIGLSIAYFIFNFLSIYIPIGYYCLKVFHEMNIHSGFTYLNINNHHDMHHTKLRGNYASIFYIFDKLYNTLIDNKKQNE